MLGNFHPQASEYLRFLPEIILSIVGIVIMMLEAVAKGKRTYLGVLSLIGIVAAFGANIWAYSDRGGAFQNMIVIDGYGTFFRALVLVVGFSVHSGFVQLPGRRTSQTGEYYALILFSLVGQCILCTASDLIMVFIGLEISSIATYILAGFLRDDRRNNESALKYFLLGSFATAFLLYGIAWIYGLTGSTNLDEVRQVLDRGQHATVSDGPCDGAAVCGLRVQSFRCSLPDLGSRCLSRRCCSRQRVHVGGPESGSIRGFLSRLHDLFPAIRRPLDSAGVGLCAAHHGHRQFRRAPADKR